MFASVPRMRSYGYSRPQQEEEKPEPGTDSTYGVRSLGSVDSDWGRHSETRDEVFEGQEVVGPEVEQAMPEIEVQADLGSAEEWTPTIDRSTPLPSTPSPTIPHQHLSLSHAYLRERDNLSEPSSPASLASMPSYTSYMSSLSRTSSLADQEATEAIEIGMGGSEELVLPTLNFPLSHSPGHNAARSRGRPVQSHGAIKVVILGEEGRVEVFMSELREVKEVVSLPRNGAAKEEYAIIGGDDVIASLTIAQSGDDVEDRLENAYTSLDGVLHPDPSPDARRRLEDLAADYAAKSDWIHLLFVLDAEASTVEALAQLVPTLSNSSSNSRLLQLPTVRPTSPIHTTAFIPDPTPRPGNELDGSNYFSSQPPSSLDAIHLFTNALAHIDEIRQASIDKFFAWRPTRARSQTDLASSHTSHESSSAFEAAAMPTVARAQGGGEWEANLSRRLAKRRQSEDNHQNQAGGSTPARRGGRRRSSGGNAPSKQSRKKAEPCGPLFPFGIGIPSDPFGRGGDGNRPILGDVLSGLKKRWKWGAFAAAAIALAIGWNWVKAT